MAYVIDAKITILCAMLIITMTYAIGLIKKRKRGVPFRKSDMIRPALVSYLFIMISLTLFPILVPPMHTEEFQYNLDITQLFQVFADRSSFISVAGNIMMFIPIGILGNLSGLRCYQNIKNAVISSFSLSVIIELLQGLETYWGFADFSSVMDINDVITNTIGGIVGFILITTYKEKDK